MLVHQFSLEAKVEITGDFRNKGRVYFAYFVSLASIVALSDRGEIIDFLSKADTVKCHSLF